MLTVFVCALLLCNFVLVALIVSGKPADKNESTQSLDLPPPDPIPKNTPALDDADILKIVKITAQEIVSELKQEWGKYEDADPKDIAETEDVPEIPDVVESEQPDEPDGEPPKSAVLSQEQINDLFGIESAPAKPKDEGMDFEGLTKTMRYVRGAPLKSEKDVSQVKDTINAIKGTELGDRITLDPVVLKRIMQIEYQLPTVEYGPEDFPDKKDVETAAKSERKILFHTKVDVRDIDEIDFNVIR